MLRTPEPLDLRRLAWSFIAVLIARPLLRFFYRCRQHNTLGALRRPAVFAANHRSFLDPILVGAYAERPLAFFARADLWKYPVIGPVLRFFGGFPIDRDEPQLQIMRRAVAELRAGRSILVFPEGTRTRDGRLGTLRDGAALFARRAGVPVVPIYLSRTETAWPRRAALPAAAGRIAIVIGPALIPPADLPAREQDRWLTVRLQEWMQDQELGSDRAKPGPG